MPFIRAIIRSIAFVLLLVAAPALGRESVIGMNERVFKVINEAQALMDEEDYQEALEVLEPMRDKRLTSYETAQVLRLIGLVHYQMDRLDAARTAYEQALSQPRLPESMATNLLGTLGRIGLMQEDYAYAEKHLARLLETPEQDTAQNRVLLANAYVGSERYEQALEQLTRAIESEREQGGPPQESWLSLLASVYYSLEDYEGMRSVMRELVERYPREQYLMNLAALHGQLGDREQQLALVESLLDDDRLEQETHLRMLASLFLAENLPFKAARLLDAEIERGRVAADEDVLEQLSQAWYLAQELDKAVPPLERAAAMAETGELYMRLAGLHMEAYRWAEAEAAAARALERGGLRKEGSAWLVRGMAKVRLNQFAQARRFFYRAEKFDESRAYASQWLAYVDGEEAAQRSVAASR
jgi:tetratricopeptide (TPR) repeat protein